MELVYIEWEDAGAADDEMGWVHLDGISEPEPHSFRQAGFVFDCDPWAIVLTEAHGGYGGAGQIAPRTRIPLGMIRRFVRLDPSGWPQEEET